MLNQYCIQNDKDGIQIRVYTMKKESATHISQFTAVKGKRILRGSWAQFREQYGELRLIQNGGFLIKKRVRTWL